MASSLAHSLAHLMTESAYAPSAQRCPNPQAAVLLQVTPLCCLQPETVAFLEVLAAEGLDAEEGLFDLCEGKPSSSLTFIDCYQAVNLMETLIDFEQGFYL